MSTNPPDRLTFLQRQNLKGLRKQANKRPDEPLSPDDWELYWAYGSQPTSRALKRLLRAVPSTPRCGFCGAPFAGIGARVFGPLGFRPSRKNPNVCSTCVELAPPGGFTCEIGVLFADLRGFTSSAESRAPVDVSTDLRRFYAHAERVFFPEALIDKFIGDEVMALYLPPIVKPGADQIDDDLRRHVVSIMVTQAQELLERVGYGTTGTPQFEVGIGIDYGEAFIGNLGDTAVHDFTAVGDVVNTASRLQDHAEAGDVVISARAAAFLDAAGGEPETLDLKGKQEPFAARRIRHSHRA